VPFLISSFARRYNTFELRNTDNTSKMSCEYRGGPVWDRVPKMSRAEKVSSQASSQDFVRSGQVFPGYQTRDGAKIDEIALSANDWGAQEVK